MKKRRLLVVAIGMALSEAALAQDCAAGFSSLTGMEPCTACTIGTFQELTGQTFCQQASPGFFVDIMAATAQEACTAGFFATGTGNSACTAAPAGFFVAGTAAEMAEACSLGQFQNMTGQTFCFDAQPGFFVGTTGATQATACPVGRYQDLAGQTTCKLASPGFFVDNPGASQQTPAPAGFFVANPGAIMADACEFGQFQDMTGQTACLDAQPGFFVGTTGATQATACSVGRYQDLTGQSACKLASPGFFVDTPGASQQTPAPAGFFVGGAGAEMAEPCSFGQFQDMTGQTACLDAQPGFFVGMTGATSATACDPGSYQDLTGQSACKLASPGFFVDSAGASMQTAAPGGFFVAGSGALMAEPCALGEFQDQTGQTACLDAPLGFFVGTTGQTFADPCPLGRFQDLAGQSACKLASPGFFVGTTGAIDQTAAPVGQFVDLPGQSAAQDCPAGSVSFGGSIACRTTINATGPNLVSPRFDSAAGRGGLAIIDGLLAPPDPVAASFPIFNAANAIGQADPLTRLTLNALTDITGGPGLGLVNFTPGTTLDEGETLDLDLGAGRIGVVPLRLLVDTDEGADLGDPGVVFQIEVVAAVDGEDVSVGVLADRPTVTVGDPFQLWLVAANPGLAPATDNALSVALPTGLSCTWQAVSEGPASGSAASLNAGGTDLPDLGARSRVLYTGNCAVDGSAVSPVDVTTVLVPGTGIDDVDPGNDANGTTIGIGATGSGTSSLRVSPAEPRPLLSTGFFEEVTWTVTNDGPDPVSNGNFAVLFFGTLEYGQLTCPIRGSDCGTVRQAGTSATAVDTPINLAAGASVDYTVIFRNFNLETQPLKAIAVATVPPGATQQNAPAASVTIEIQSGIFADGFE